MNLKSMAPLFAIAAIFLTSTSVLADPGDSGTYTSTGTADGHGNLAAICAEAQITATNADTAQCHQDGHLYCNFISADPIYQNSSGDFSYCEVTVVLGYVD